MHARAVTQRRDACWHWPQATCPLSASIVPEAVRRGIKDLCTGKAAAVFGLQQSTCVFRCKGNYVGRLAGTGLQLVFDEAARACFQGKPDHD
jgi:hypothetical protein